MAGLLISSFSNGFMLLFGLLDISSVFVHLDEGLKGCERKAIVIEDLMSLSKKDVKCSLRQYEHSAA